MANATGAVGANKIKQRAHGQNCTPKREVKKKKDSRKKKKPQLGKQETVKRGGMQLSLGTTVLPGMQNHSGGNHGT